MPQDFAESSLAQALASFVEQHPMVAVDAHVERNSRIAVMLAEGALDLAVLIGKVPAPGGERATPVASAWLAGPGFVPAPGEPLPLLLLEEPCVFREFALEALRRAGISHSIVFTSPSVSGLWAAVSAGMGLTVRMPLGTPPQVQPIEARHLPALPAVHLTLHRGQRPPSAAADRLWSIVADSLETLGIAATSSFLRGRRSGSRVRWPCASIQDLKALNSGRFSLSGCSRGNAPGRVRMIAEYWAKRGPESVRLSSSCSRWAQRRQAWGAWSWCSSVWAGNCAGVSNPRPSSSRAGE